jgi:enamine deaminase RidA (YjgF/YER057c/UK114 family)
MILPYDSNHRPERSLADRNCFAAAAAEKKIIAPEGSDLGLPFSPGVLSGDFLYLAGSIGNKPGTLELPAGIEAQTRQTMANPRSVLSPGWISRAW